MKQNLPAGQTPGGFYAIFKPVTLRLLGCALTFLGAMVPGESFAIKCPSSNNVTPNANQIRCVGVAATLLSDAVTTTGTGGTATQSFQWYYNTTNSNVIAGATAIVGATSQTYTPLTTVTEVGTRYYFCVGYSTDVACGTTATTQSLASNTVQVTVNPLPATTIVSGAGTYCISTTITANNGSDGIMYFQGSTSNGTSVATPSASQLITTSGTYYFRAQSAAGCWGAQGSAVVTINNPAAPTGTASQSFCAINNPTVANLVATGSGIQWYAASSGGTALSTSTALVNGTHYYASQTVSGCEGTARFDVTATVGNPAAPTGTATQSFCAINNPTVANLAATGTAIKWYAASSGGTALATSTALVNGTHYYASQTVSGCEGTARFDVTATVNNPVAPTGTATQSFCAINNPTVANLAATGTAIKWYAASSGGTALATSTALVNGTHYYASQTVSGCEGTARFDVTATVSNPAAPTGTASQSFCAINNPTVANLVATGSGIQWYAASSGGTALSTSTALLNGTHYYASQTISGCEGTARFDVTATVGNPAAPTGTATQSFCVINNPTVANLAATGTAIKWYAASSGGTALATSTSLVNGTHYYASQTVSGCEGITRFDVTATVSDPAAPTGTATQSFCAINNPTVANLAATGTAIKWYAVSSGGIALATSSALVDGTHYYASQTVSGCEGTARFDVTATVSDPAAPTGAASQSFCAINNPTVADLAVTGAATKWYIVASGGTALATSTALVNGTHYYASQTVSGCEGTARFDVTATVGNPAAPTGTAAQSFCSNNNSTVADLVATGTNIQWYSVSSGGTVLATTDPLVNGTHYYASQTVSGCEGVSRLDVTANIFAPPVITADPDPSQTVCNTYPATFSVSATGDGLTYQWYKGALALSDNAFITGSNTNQLIIDPTAASDAGTYHVVVSGLAPCADAVSADAVFNVDQIITITTQPVATQTFCEGQDATFSVASTGSNLSYQWRRGTTDLVDGSNISGATTATLTVSGLTTADATSAATRYNVVIIDAAVDPGDCNTAFSNSAALVVNKKSVDPVSVSTTGGITTICNGGSTVLTLNGGGGGTGETIHWYSGSCGGTAVGTGNNITVSPTVTTTYYGRYEDPSPCNYSSNCASVTITVNQKSADPTSAAATPALICNGQSTTLTLNGGGGGDGETIKWYSGSCGGTSVGSGNNLSVSPTVTTTYYGRYENGAPCSYNSACVSVTVTVNQKSANPTSATASSTTICNGGSTSLSLVGGGGGTNAVITWYSGSCGGTLVGTGNGLSVSPVITTTYYGRYEDGAPCNVNTACASVTINVSQAPTISNAGGDQSICGTSATLAANTPTTGTGLWSIASSSGGTGGSFGSSSNPGSTFSITGFSAGSGQAIYTLVWTVSSNPCNPSTDTVVITFKKAPVANAGADKAPSCGSTSVALSGTAAFTGQTGTWTIISGIGGSVTNPNSATSTFTSAAVGMTTYTLVWTVTNLPCTAATDTMTVTIMPPITGNSLALLSVCRDAVTGAVSPVMGTNPAGTLSGGNGTYSYTWERKCQGDGGFNPIPGTTETIVVPQNSTNCFYRRTVVSGSCSNTSPGSGSDGHINTNNLPTSATLVTPTTGTGSYCNGGSGIVIGTTGSVAPVAAGGTTPGYSASYELFLNNVSTGITRAGTGAALNFGAQTAAGTYTVKETITITSGTNGCGTTTFPNSFTIVIDANVTPADAGTAQTVCNAATLAGNTPVVGTGLWLLVSGSGTITTPTNPTTTVTALGTGNNVFKWRITNGTCADSMNVTINASQPSVAPTSLTASLNPICNTPGSTTLTQTGGVLGTNAKWQWYTDAAFTSPVGGLLSTANASLTVSPTVTTTYYLRAEISPATPCPQYAPATTSVTVTVNQPSVAPTSVTASPKPICSGDATTLTQTDGTLGTGAGWQWYSDASFTTKVGGLVAAANASLSVSPTITTTYYIRAESTTAPCTAVVSNAVNVQVIVNQPNIVPASLSASVNPICNGGSTTLTQNGGTLGTSAKWQWYTDPGYTVPVGGQLATANASISVSPSVTTTYYLRMEANAAPCATNMAAGNITVTVNPRPTSVISGTAPICAGNAAMLSITFTGTGPWNFTLSDGTVFSGIATNPYTFSVSPTALTTYTVTALTDANCTAIPADITGSATITVNPLPAATIGTTTAVCENDPSPGITFTGSNGTAPYTFTYTDYLGNTQTASGNPLVTIAGPPTTTAGTFTYTLVSVRDNSSSTCLQNISGQTATITVNPKPVIDAVQSPVSTCSGSSSITPVISGTTFPPGTSYTWSAPLMTGGMTGTGLTGTNTAFTTGVFTNTTTAVQTATYTITPASGAGCTGTSFTLVVNVDPSIAGAAVWLGKIDDDWCNGANWSCGVVPTATTNVLIPSGAANNDPVQIGAGCNAFAMDITVQNGAKLGISGSGYLKIFGNLTNTGDPDMYTFGGTVDFSGGTGNIGGPQTIPAFTYNNVRVSGGTTKTLAGPARVNGTLILDDGLLISSTANMLTISASGDITNASDQSYVEGPITRETNSTNPYNFPVGGAGAVRVVTVTPVDVNPSSYTVYYQQAPTGGTVLGPDLFGILSNEYWDVLKNAGEDAQVGFFYKNPGSPSGWSSGIEPCAFCNVAVVEKDASNNWYYTGGSTSSGFGPTESTYWQSNGMVDSRSLLTGGSGRYSFGYGYAIVLPVTLIDFTGALQGNNAVLKWSFAAGSDVATTELQHSSDGAHFSTITIKAASNTYAYDHIHFNLPPGSHYYRLLIKDKNGKQSYSKTILLMVGKDITVIKGVRPTMVHTETFIDIYSVSQQTVRCVLYDVTGRAVAEYKGKLQEGENSYRIPANSLAQGLYTLQVKTEDGVMANLRFMKD